MNDHVDQNIYEQRTQLLFDNARISNVVVLIVVGIMTYTMHGHVSDVAVFGWCIIMVALAVSRTVLLVWRDRRRDAAKPQSWVRRYGSITVLMGLCWAWFAIIGYGANLRLDLIVLIVIIGLIALAVPALISFPTIVFFYSIPAGLAIAGQFLMDPELDNTLIGVAVLAFIAMIIKSTFNFHQVLLDSLRLNFSNAELNDQLNVEIEERRNTQDELEHYQKHLESLVELRTEELVRARDAAEAGNRAKSQFLANMSHEIRTPLNAIMGFSDIGSKKTSDQRVLRAFSQIRTSGKQLIGIVDDVLQASQIEAGKLNLERRPFLLSKTVDASLSQIAASASAKGLEIELLCDEKLPGWVEGDQVRLQQVLSNLLTNAVKFTSEGAVGLRVARNGRQILFEVFDSGIGMDVAEIDRLLKPFEQADASSTRRYGGVGLGLAITSDLVRSMQGKLEVRSEPGNGSTFSVTLPLRGCRPPEASERSGDQPDNCSKLRGLNVLIAEDVESNQLVIQDILEECGANVRFVLNGRDAVEFVERNEQHLDIVLMDIQMPVMDGYEATQRIRRLKPELPIVGVTAHALGKERKKILDAGMLDHLTKPINRGALVESILTHTARRH